METTPIRVMWFVPPLLALVAAEDQQGVPVQGQRNRSSDEQFDALVAGDVDAVVTSMDNVIGWNSRPGPKDFRVVAQIERTTPLSLVARSGLAELKDLREANILVDAPDNGFVVALKAMLREAGLLTEEYRLTPAGGVKERFDALMSGQGDATLLGPPFAGSAIASGLVCLATIQEKYPHFPGQGVVTRKGNPGQEKVSLWLAALERARIQITVAPEVAFKAVKNAGLPAQFAEGMIALNPDSLLPTHEGIALLVDHRWSLGLVGGDALYPTIVEESLIESNKGTAQ